MGNLDVLMRTIWDQIQIRVMCCNLGTVFITVTIKKKAHKSAQKKKYYKKAQTIGRLSTLQFIF